MRSSQQEITLRDGGESASLKQNTKAAECVSDACFCWLGGEAFSPYKLNSNNI